MNFKEMSDKDVIAYVDKKIKAFQDSDLRKDMLEAAKYYVGDNCKIKSRKMEYYNGKCNVTDPYRANNTLASNFFRPIVKQKVSTLINEGLTMDNEAVKLTLGSDFIQRLTELGEVASQKVYAVWQVFKVDDRFAYMSVKPENTIFIDHPIFKDEFIAVIRYWKEKVKNKDIVVCQLWTADEVYTIKDYKSITREPHGVTKVMYGQVVDSEEPASWGAPPFVRLYNNHEHISDLKSIKDMIDIYDVVNSDFANNFEDFQEMYWVLKNFNGQDIDEYFDAVKKYKAVYTDSDGDARLEGREVPAQARQEFLKMTEQNIYKFAMAVDTNDTSSGDMTNVVLKSRYENLKLKVNDFESQVNKAISQLLDLVNAYYKMMSLPEQQTEITYDRTMIVNEVEYAKLANESIGAISEKTRLKNDPRVKDVEEEIKMMQKDQGVTLE